MVLGAGVVLHLRTPCSVLIGDAMARCPYTSAEAVSGWLPCVNVLDGVGGDRTPAPPLHTWSTAYLSQHWLPLKGQQPSGDVSGPAN